jgi:Flp pilus assembly pilin Flp
MLDLERRSRFRNQDGQGAVEYGLLIGFGALLVIVAMLYLAASIDSLVRRTGQSTPISSPRSGDDVVACDPGYTGACVPPHPPDLDCSDLEARGIAVPVTIVGGDPHNLDPDGDGVGCD